MDLGIKELIDTMLPITAVRFNHKTPPEKAEVGAKRFLAEAVLRYTIPG
jgi:hypothetical protein